MAIKTEDVLLAQQGDQQAFSRLYEEISLDLYKLALYMLGNAEDAQDMVSETFIEAFKGLKNLREAESFKPWIFRILSIRCKRKITTYIKEKGNIDIADYVEEGIGGGENARTEVGQALDSITADEREIVVLSVIHGYTMKEIAQMKDLPQGTVSSKLHRTLKKLKDKLSN